MARRYKTSMNASCSVMGFPLGLLESDLVERFPMRFWGLALCLRLSLSTRSKRGCASRVELSHAL